MEISSCVCLGNTVSAWNPVPSLNNGNIKHTSTGFMVPRDGIYYVYAQLQFDPDSGSSQNNCAFELVASSSKVIAAAHNWVPSPSSNDKVIYTGSAAYLYRGNTVSVKMRGTCRLDSNYNEEAFLGGFFLRN